MIFRCMMRASLPQRATGVETLSQPSALTGDRLSCTSRAVTPLMFLPDARWSLWGATPPQPGLNYSSFVNMHGHVLQLGNSLLLYSIVVGGFLRARERAGLAKERRARGQPCPGITFFYAMRT